ncbi:transposase [Saccharolobus sp. A20]|uniref:transposase n=1 Tax=Saccharolobus sp. A20 TaxID=1891280 RepID=UPI000A87DFAB|nr:transposase [Sulfolobus sp. A20]
MKKPPFIQRVSLPGYWKENEKRKLILVVRQDHYEVDEERHAVMLKDWKMEMPFVGKLGWFGVKGRLETHIVDNKFYASIPVDVSGIISKKSNKPMKDSLIIHGERDKIQIAIPKGDKTTSIDLGINMLATVVMDDGTVLFYRGSIVKSDYFYFRKRVCGQQFS